jgi:hypothetical protein
MYGPMNVVGWSSQASCGLETLRIGVRMELRTYCAYNQTRESFLGLEVAAGDLSYKSLSCEGALTLRPNEGLWLRPFRGIPDSGVTAPVDLIYLDKECRVIDMAESFPVNRSGAGGQDADTLLVLPSHSIFSSDTQKGDQFVLCVPEEMPRRLERLCNSGREAPPAFGGNRDVRAAGESAHRQAAAVLDRCEEEDRHSETEDADLSTTRKGFFRSPRNWLQRILSPPAPVKERAPRKPAPSVAAYYWDGHGVPPTGHAIRDISSTGIYLLTEDRWYEGTLILMSLEDKGDVNPDGQNVLSVNARVVRSDGDGVGLQFLAARGEGSAGQQLPRLADQKDVAAFLDRIMSRSR